LRNGVLVKVLIALALVGIACGSRTETVVRPHAQGPDYASAFPRSRIVRLDITISPASWNAMQDDASALLGTAGEWRMPPIAREEPPASDRQIPALPMRSRDPIYVDADLRIGERTWRHVGIRYKGNSTLMRSWHERTGRLPLRIDMDRFEERYPETKDQTLFGFAKLSLSIGDPSALRQKLSNELFAAAGLPTPATAFYRVFIDHGAGPQDLGIYTVTELPSDRAFLDAAFGSHTGNLYKPEGHGARWDTFDAASLNKQRPKRDPDVRDARALYDALHADRTDAPRWRRELERRFDVDRFLRWLAVNTAILEWDAYGQMPHNYYLYADPRAGSRLTWIHWDHNESLGASPMRPPRGVAPPSGMAPPGMAPPGMAQPPAGMRGMPGPRADRRLDHSDVDDRWPLIRYVLDDQVYARRYRAHLRDVVATVFVPSRVEARAREAHALVASQMKIDDERATLESALAELIAFVHARSAMLQSWLVAQPQ